ncbi:MAG: DNA alkylation repair protein [Bacteroidales bacterium]|nr:DNA alkylation repair protein [Bacteroidales bacterium]
MKPTAQDLAAYLESLRNEEQRQQLMRFFKTGKGDYANNWGLVDLSAPRIIGRWLTLPTRLGNRQEMVDGLAASGNLWRERISMVCTWMTTRMGEPSWCLRYAEMHLHHKHDLMHKAVGWMLRELGKQVDMDLLREFLKQHVHEMSRTTLRYAIEKMPDEERKYWMRL